ncbi:MAG: hypothetical protein ACQXXH_04605 [Candidatus Bathyarchaeia archaeon]|nr:hypothetical protein [Candidatus Bathyarchaeota archaeon A05DMB-4]MDH7595017.1 hypothetical protein [Candidatus Bathyarchaeota archaeon]
MNAGDASEKISVNIKFKDIEQKFEGDVNDVWYLINKFFSETVPNLKIVRKLLLTVDMQKLMEDCKDIVAITPEGTVILISKGLLTDNEAIMLHLLACYVGYKIGVLKTDLIAKDSLQKGLGKNAKIISTRLGELCRKGYVVKMNDAYKISTMGIKTLQSELLPKLKQNLGSKP